MNEAIFMFGDPVLALVNAVLLLGILLAVVAAPFIIRSNRKLHRRTLAMRELIRDDGVTPQP